MSVILMGEVWKLDLPPGQLMLALALADHGHDDGTHIYPSVPRLAWKTGLSERQVQRLLRQFERMGLLVCVGARKGGRKQPTVYEMHPEAVPEKPPFEPDDANGDNMSPFIEETRERVTSTTEKGDIHDRKGDIHDRKGDIAMSPEPSINHHSNHKRTVDNQAQLKIDDGATYARIAQGGIAAMREWGRHPIGEAYMTARGATKHKHLGNDWRTAELMTGYRSWCAEQQIEARVG